MHHQDGQASQRIAVMVRALLAVGGGFGQVGLRARRLRRDIAEARSKRHQTPGMFGIRNRDRTRVRIVGGHSKVSEETTCKSTQVAASRSAIEPDAISSDDWHSWNRPCSDDAPEIRWK